MKKIKTVHSGEAQFTNQTTTHRYNKISSIFSIIMQIMYTLLCCILYRPANNESEVDPQGINEPNEEVSSFTLIICLLFTPISCAGNWNI